MTTAQDIITETVELRNFWAPRKQAFRKWYRMIRLHNDLAQEKMESVISSDPRTSFNMAQWLLTPQTGAFVADTEGMTEQQTQHVGRVQRYADRQFSLANRRTRVSLHGSVIRRLVSLMLATGWYALASIPTRDGWVWQAWNPAQCYPDYDSEGQLIRLGRIYSVSREEAQLRAQTAGWTLPQGGTKTLDVYSLWRMSHLGPTHAVAIGNQLVKDHTLEPVLREIPVTVAPCAGLPDDGSIMEDNKWKAEVGESLLAPIMDIQKTYDKMLTFMQQLLRDTANPRWVEEVHQKGALAPERLFDRGAVFSISPGERIYPIPTPTLPPEMRGHQFDLRSQLQRGTFSDISFGNVTQQISGFLMNQVTAAAKQTLNPFYEAIKAALSDVATRNIRIMRDLDMPLGSGSFPRLPEHVPLDFSYDVEIPGDFIQRASAAKVLNSDFKLSQTTLIDILFPEVMNAADELGRVRAEDASMHPAFQQVVLMREFTRAASEARAGNDDEFADALEAAADILQAGGMGEPGTAPAIGGVRPEAMPPGVQEVLAGR